MNLREIADVALLVAKSEGWTQTRREPSHVAHHINNYLLNLRFAERYWKRLLSSLLRSQNEIGQHLIESQLRMTFEEIAVSELLLRVTSSLLMDINPSVANQFGLPILSRHCEQHQACRQQFANASQRIHGARTHPFKSDKLQRKLSAWNDLLLAGSTRSRESVQFAMNPRRHQEIQQDEREAIDGETRFFQDQLQRHALRLIIPNRNVQDITSEKIFRERIDFALWLVGASKEADVLLSSRRNRRMIHHVWSLMSVKDQ